MTQKESKANSCCTKCGVQVWSKVAERSGRVVVRDPTLHAWGHICQDWHLDRRRKLVANQKIKDYGSEVVIKHTMPPDTRILAGNNWGVDIDDVFPVDKVNLVRCPDCEAAPGDPCRNLAATRSRKLTIRPHTNRVWCMMHAARLRMDGIYIVTEEFYKKHRWEINNSNQKRYQKRKWKPRR